MPLFIYVPDTPIKSKLHFFLLKFKEAISIGDLNRAMSYLDKGLKIAPHAIPFKMNVGVVFILQKRFLEATVVFQTLMKEFPSSQTLLCNLLFAMLCGGFFKEVKDFGHAGGSNSARSTTKPKVNKVYRQILDVYNKL